MSETKKQTWLDSLAVYKDIRMVRILLLGAISGFPWVLIASAFGLGKRVPVAQFRLQKRAGMGLRAIKFRIEYDALVLSLIHI